MPVHHHIFVPNEKQKKAQLERHRQKLDHFPHRARKELHRALKLVRGLRQQRASKLLKNTKKEGPAKNTAAEMLRETKSMPLDALVSLVLAEELGLQTAATNKGGGGGAAAAAASATPAAAPATADTAVRRTRRDEILAPLSDRQRRMCKKWIGDTRVQDAVAALRETRRQLKSKVRHMRDRLTRKERREAIKLDPSLKKKKPPKPAGLPSQKDMFAAAAAKDMGGAVADGAGYFVPVQKKKSKNRLGQRERKRLALERERLQANGPNRAMRRAAAQASGGAEGTGTGGPSGKRKRPVRGEQGQRPPQPRQGLQQKRVRTDDRAITTRASAAAGEDAKAPAHHPSWAARSLAREKLQQASFSGKKKTFDDSDDDDSD